MQKDNATDVVAVCARWGRTSGGGARGRRGWAADGGGVVVAVSLRVCAAGTRRLAYSRSA
jgi:hypothetical protein